MSARERDLVKSEVDGGMDNNPHSQELAQGRETGRANERKQYHADNPLDLTVEMPTQGAKRGANKKKTRDSETTGPPPQAVVSIGNTRTNKKGLQSHNKEVNTPNLQDEIPTSKDTEPIAKDVVNSPARMKDTINPSHQAGADLMRSSTGNEGLCPHGRIGKPERPDKDPMRKDSDSASKNRQSQPRQKVRTALNGTEPPLCHTPDHSLTPIIKGGRGQLPGPTAQEPDGLILDPLSAITGSVEFTYTASSGPGMRREEHLLEKYGLHTTDLNNGAKTALPGALEPMPAETKDNEPESTLTQAETNSIEKRRRRQARAKGQAKKSTACFAYDTTIQVKGPEKASWTPIWLVGRGSIVVQSLPSGNIEDLTDAMMTKVETVCTFGCSASGIDIVQMGGARITAHHHIQTSEGWMTARQAAKMGHGALLTNQAFPLVYSLYLEGGGNIIINTTAFPQAVPTQILAATMGCRFEPAIDPLHKGLLTYSDTTRVHLGQIRGMELGRKDFKANEVETLPNGELHF